MNMIATPANRVRDSFQLPKSLRARARGLFDQQLWNFGCDARNAAGNIMIAFGFDRHRPATFGLGSTAYALNVGDHHTQLVIWGFGAFAGEPNEGVFLRRFKFSPTHATSDQPLIHVHLPSAIRARTLTGSAHGETRRRQLHELLDTFARYEGWVQEVHGVAYREFCLRERTPRARRQCVRPADIPNAWQEIASRFADSVTP